MAGLPSSPFLPILASQFSSLESHFAATVTTFKTSTDIATIRTTPTTRIAPTASTTPSASIAFTVGTVSTASTESTASTASTDSNVPTSSSASASSTAPTDSTTVTSSSSTSTSSDNVELVTSTSLDTSSHTTSTKLVVQTAFIPAGTSKSAASVPVASNRSNTGAIVGGVVGAGVLIGLILLLYFFMCRARKPRDKANFDPVQFRHTGEKISGDDPSDHHLPARIEELLFPFPPLPVSGFAYNRGNRRRSLYGENIAGVGSFGVHTPKSRPAPDPVKQGATFSKQVHLTYKQPPLSSADAPAPSHPYREQYSDKKDLPMLAVQIESALTDDYVESSAPSYKAAPRRKPVPEIKSDLYPSHPPKRKEFLHGEENLPSQSGEVSPFADPKSEPPPILRPGFVNVPKKSTHDYGYGDGGAYDAIS